MTPIVSVCIPTYNRPGWLNEAIQSVLHQKEIDFEIVVLDNGSDPKVKDAEDRNTEDILEQYSNDKRFYFLKRITNNPDWTQMVTRTNGSLLTILPDDDLLVGDYSLASRANFLMDHPDCAFVFSRVRGHDADGNDLGPLQMGNMAPWDLPSRAAPFDRLFLDCFVPFPSGVFDAKYRHLLYSPEIKKTGCSGDWAFWLALAKDHDQAYLAEPTVSLRQHPNQDTNVRGHTGGFLDAHLKVWRHYIENRILVPDLAGVTYMMQYAEAASRSEEERSQAVNEIQNLVKLIKEK